MNLRLNRLWPLFFITAFLFVPKLSFAAEWTNVGFANNNVKTVYVDPKDNQRILVSLASVFEGSYNFYTENGGTNWNPMNMGGAVSACNTFFINPKSLTEVWAGCNPGIFRSIDGGKTFTSAAIYFRNSQISQLQISAEGVVFIVNSAQELWRSTDGIIWEQSFVPGAGNTTVFLNKYSQNEVYVSKTGSTGPGLYKSSDRGITWMNVNSAAPIRNGVGQMIFTSSGKICASVGTYGVGCSTDGGFTWGTFASPNPERPVEFQHFYRLEQNPDDENNLLVLAGTWGGLDTKIYSYKAGVALPEILTVPNYTGAITISQGVVYSWSQNTTWTKGIWRNDGIVVVPEYLKKHPVIIVPGFLGSWSTSPFGGWDFDPILNTYTNLYDQFLAAGYEPGITLFKFPYQWRADNRETASLLKEKIDEAKVASGASKVDIVAHSMGGIVTRIYAQGDSYQNDIDQIVFMGTPQMGSVSSYPMWEAADLSQNEALSRVLFWAILKEEAWQHGYTRDALLLYIRNDVPSISQLLPIYSYINGRTYPDGYPRNELLEMLDFNKLKLKERNIRVTNIIGTDTPTSSNIDVLNGDFGIYWPDGKIVKYYSGLGDGTVILESQTAVPGDTVTKNGVKHRDLPNLSVNDVFRSLGINYSSTEVVNNINKYLFVVAYSPIDFYVLAPDGKKIGFNKNGASFNEIEGAFYTGNDSEIEFITIPNPLPGEYKVSTLGTDTGSYEIEVTFADGESNTTFSDNYFGETIPGKENELPFVFSLEQQSIKIEKPDDSIKQKEENVSSNTNDNLTIVSTSQAFSMQDDVVFGAYPEVFDTIGLKEVLGKSQEVSSGNENVSTNEVYIPTKGENIFSSNNLALLLVVLILIEVVIVKYRYKNKAKK